MLIEKIAKVISDNWWVLTISIFVNEVEDALIVECWIERDHVFL
jgi:hypothetical protein